VRKLYHSVMTSWIEYNHPWGKGKSQASIGDEEIRVEREQFLQLARSEEK
jgi:hypothetical protein